MPQGSGIRDARRLFQAIRWMDRVLELANGHLGLSKPFSTRRLRFRSREPESSKTLRATQLSKTRF